MHALLGVRTLQDLHSHPKVGASWEGYALEECLKVIEHDEAYFWATHQGAELDLLLRIGKYRFGIEVKYADAPTLTASMRVALADLGLDRLLVAYPGERAYALDPRVDVVPLSHLIEKGNSLLRAASRRGT